MSDSKKLNDDIDIFYSGMRCGAIWTHSAWLVAAIIFTVLVL
jgi:hypothetical protein